MNSVKIKINYKYKNNYGFPRPKSKKSKKVLSYLVGIIHTTVILLYQQLSYFIVNPTYFESHII